MNSEKIGPETAYSQNMLNIQTHMANDRHWKWPWTASILQKLENSPVFLMEP